MKVGIFDSGMGGLSVLRQALRKMPGVQFLYYADEAHVPYGEKTREQILGYIDEIIEFMLNKGVDAILIACNTATSVADKEYRSQFSVPIIGMEPAVKQAVEQYVDEPGRILVVATPVTIAGEKLHHLLEIVDKTEEVDLVALPGLVRFAERKEFESAEVAVYLKDALNGYLEREYKALVLGCTHFNYFKKEFRKIFPDTLHFVDGNAGTIRQMLRKLPAELPDAEPSVERVEYYFSGREVTAEEKESIDIYLRQLDAVEKIN